MVFSNPFRWYTIKFLQAIDKTALEVPGYADAVNLIIVEAEKAGLLVRMAGPMEMPVFGLNPEYFHITASVGQLRCSKCGQLLSVQRETSADWFGVPCHRRDCGETINAFGTSLI